MSDSSNYPIIEELSENERKRIWRDSALLATDKYMFSDFPITEDQKEEITAYRQALRDFTENEFILPKKPAWLNI